MTTELEAYLEKALTRKLNVASRLQLCFFIFAFYGMVTNTEWIRIYSLSAMAYGGIQALINLWEMHKE